MSRLIAILDDLDGDPEAEPLLGAPEVRRLKWTSAPQTVAGMDQRWWTEGTNDDREGGDVQDEPHNPEPDEPWLGAAERHPGSRGLDQDQTQVEWARSALQDGELVNEDGGP